MNLKVTSKKELYQAIGFTMLLVVSAFPFAILGMRILNSILG
jgi:hypothetical protein